MGYWLEANLPMLEENDEYDMAINIRLTPHISSHHFLPAKLSGNR